MGMGVGRKKKGGRENMMGGKNQMQICYIALL